MTIGAVGISQRVRRVRVCRKVRRMANIAVGRTGRTGEGRYKAERAWLMATVAVGFYCDMRACESHR